MRTTQVQRNKTNLLKLAMLGAVAAAISLGALSGQAQAKSPTDDAESYNEAMAYRYAYIAKVFSAGEGSDISEPANLAWGMALFALESGEDSAWYECYLAASEAEAAASAAGESSIAWYSGLAADYALDAYLDSLMSFNSFMMMRSF